MGSIGQVWTYVQMGTGMVSLEVFALVQLGLIVEMATEILNTMLQHIYITIRN